MHRVGLTRAGIVSPIVAVLDRVGAPVEELLARANIPAWARTDPEMLIPTSNVARLLAEGTRTQGIENLGLLAGQEARIESLGIFGRLIRRSRTLGEALDAGFLSREESEVLDPLGSGALGEEARDVRCRNQHLRVGASPRGDVGSREKLFDGRADAVENGHDGRNDASARETHPMH